MHKPYRSFAKKVFAAGLAVSTALWASAGLFVFVAQAVEAHPAGTLVLSSGTVWQITDDGAGRKGFESAAKFYSHRYKWSDVVAANSADLALADQGLVSWGNGVLINDGGTVYQVSGGVKHGFTSAANFTGNGFSFSQVVAASLSGVSAGANIDNTTAAHLEGTFVNDSGTVYMITATGKKGIPSPGVLYSYGAGFADVVSANAADKALASEANLSFRTGALVNDGGTIYAVTATTKKGFPTASCFTGFGFTFAMPVSGSTSGLTAGANYCAGEEAPPVGAGTLTMSLASDTPVAATVVKNAARVGFTKVNFAASGGDVTIDSLTVERTGVSLDSSFSDIILLDVSDGKSVAQANQLGNEKSLGSTHKATFGDDIVVKNGTTKSILIAANLASTVQTADQAKLELVEVVVAGSATKSGTLPIAGNAMTMNNNVAIATVTVAAGGANPAASTQNVGATDYIVSSIKLTAGSQEDIEVSRIRFYENGTAADTDVKNLELVVDGAVVGTLTNPVSKAAEFNLATPITITKGNNKDFDLRLDIADGSARTISLDIDKKVDVVAKGKTYGYFRLPTYPNTTAPYFNAADTTINKGAITFSKGVLASLNVAEGSTNQPLGAFKATVQGEPVQVTQFVIGATVAGTGNMTDITDYTVKDAAGNIVAGPVDPDTTVTARDTATSTDTIIFPVGTNTYTIYAKLGSDFAANDTIVVDLPDPDGLVTAKGTVTNQTVTAAPTSDLSLDTVTVKAGNLKVSTSTSPAAQSVIIGASGFIFANYVLDASDSGEDVRVSQFVLVHKTSANSIQTNLANLTLYDGTTALAPIVQPSAVAATTASSTFSLTNVVVVPKGGTKTITLKGDVVAGSAGQTHSFGCNGAACVNATGASTANSVAATATNSDGQTMTLASSGTFTVAEDASSPGQGALLAGGQTKATVGVLLFTSKSEEIDLSEVHFTATAVNGGALNDEFAMAYLFDGGTQIASVSPTTTGAVTFVGLTGKFRFGASGKKLTVKVDTAAVTNQGGDGNTADAGDGVYLAVAEDAYAGKGVSSGSSVAAGSMSGTFTGQQFTVYKSLPTWSKLALASNTLVNTSGVPLFKFKITADAKGDIGFYQASFAITTTTATVTAFELYEEPGTTNQINLTNNGTRSVGSATSSASEVTRTPLIASSDGKGGQYAIRVVMDTGSDGVANGGEFRFISAGESKTFELRGTVANSTTGSTVSVVVMGDNAFAGTYPNCAGYALGGTNSCSGIGDLEQGKFIWSDMHYGNSSTTATNTAEWFNGYRVSGLTTTSTAETLSK